MGRARRTGVASLGHPLRRGTRGSRASRGLVADLFQVVPPLVEELKKHAAQKG